jgi:hypothetical protein
MTYSGAPLPRLTTLERCGHSPRRAVSLAPSPGDTLGTRPPTAGESNGVGVYPYRAPLNGSPSVAPRVGPGRYYSGAPLRPTATLRRVVPGEEPERGRGLLFSFTRPRLRAFRSAA